MKVMRFFGVFLLCVGCVAAFVGMAAAVLPMIQNDQLRLVLSSFETPSQNLVVNAMNSAMVYALRHCYAVMVSGAVVALAGALWLLRASKGAARTAPTPWEKEGAPRQPASSAYTIPKWQASKAQDAIERNPFASGIAVAGGRGAVPGRDDAPSETMNTFAPAVQGKTSHPAPRRMSDSPYAPPILRDAPEQSPYARPTAEPVKPEQDLGQIYREQRLANSGHEAQAVSMPEAPAPVIPPPIASAAAPASAMPAMPPSAAPAGTLKPSPGVKLSGFGSKAPAAPKSAADGHVIPAFHPPAAAKRAKPRIKSTMGKHSE